MNDPGFIVLTIALLGALLFMLSPRPLRHWVVLVFVFLSLLITLFSVPSKFLIILILAIVLWVGSVLYERLK